MVVAVTNDTEGIYFSSKKRQHLPVSVAISLATAATKCASLTSFSA